MMILSAVILLLAFIALAGMVARVSQLASATTSESDRVILSEVGPLSTALDQGICRLKDSRTTTRSSLTADLTSGSTSLTDLRSIVAPVGPTNFAANEVGMTISGSGIQSGTRILSVSLGTAVLSLPATANGANTAITLVPCLLSGVTTTFGLGATATATAPRLEDAVGETLAHLRSIEAQHGFFLETSTECWTDPDGAGPRTALATQGRAVLELSDGTVWIQIKSTVPFTKSGC